MFHPRTIQLTRKGAGSRITGQILAPIRSFSQTQCHGDQGASPKGNPNVTPKKHSPSGASPRPDRRKTNVPPVNLNPKNTTFDRPRYRRVVDARSLAAPQAGRQPGAILHNPRFRGNRNSFPPRSGKPTRPPGKSGFRDKKFVRGGPKSSEADAGDTTQKDEVENAFVDIVEKGKPVPVRYSPRACDYAALKESWPAFPTDANARAAGVAEKLYKLGDRLPNGYTQPEELGKRLFMGQYVQFASEEERTKAMAVANKLSQQRADKFSQRKGDVVESQEIGFDPLRKEDQQSLFQSLVQGRYPSAPTQQADKSPVIGDILKNLENNETYQMAGKSSQFMKKMESLLAAGRPVKRS
ncbi:uncharacterized protein BDW47DRAFT_113071 [Aspergillus candidus]|uniref:Uncharacterized protein n=1 Tax=Aspergillus candidus TaxID=41067 RepID=A0A2I2F026_ASPCN|nr:hypothetical protein BDW47DRAFT_113071 [Aspergillus candidus]PLB33987.1 hypothetical protein BDW47DRAFT_113071 [Aspergillus candidus]